MNTSNGQTTVDGLSRTAKNKAMQAKNAVQDMESRMADTAGEISQNLAEKSVCLDCLRR